jgi:hypothetical protein
MSGAERITSSAGIKSRRFGVVHVYIRADDDLEAGSYISDRCEQNGLVFGEYLLAWRRTFGNYSLA